MMSVRAERSAFLSINLRNVRARPYFDSMGGVAGSKWADLRAVTPLTVFNRREDRFADARAVRLGADPRRASKGR